MSVSQTTSFPIPSGIVKILEVLQAKGFLAYIVGGCVRDLLRGKEAQDWDIATNAKPEEIQAIFPDSFYENEFGTVTVKVRDEGGKEEQLGQKELGQDKDIIRTTIRTLGQNNNVLINGQMSQFPSSGLDKPSFSPPSPKIPSFTPLELRKGKPKIEDNDKITKIEITTFRKEGRYSDKRHPDSIQFAKTIEDDLARRDFTMNAVALRAITRDKGPSSAPSELQEGKQGTRDAVEMECGIVDPYDGQKDIRGKLIRAVGNPNERFQEDAIRLMRAVRFAATLGFEISRETHDALVKNAHFINNIAKERVRDELIKIIDSPRAHEGIELMQKSGLLKHVLPEIEAGVGVGQNKHHIYTVYEHNLYALKWSAENNYPFHVKLASFLHDVGKPQTKQGDGINSTFYGHEIVGAKIAKQALRRLKFPNETVDNVWMLVRYHLFYYNVGEVTESSVRRLVAKIGPENIDDLLKVRVADRKGSGVPKALPYLLLHFLYIII